LYSGEQFDSKVGQQYLRARYYDPATGRFNRLDPFFGNLKDPQSFHKYLYTHADPVSGVDPTGEFLGLAGAILGGLLGFRYKSDVINIGVGHRITYTLIGAVGGYAMTLAATLTLANFGPSAYYGNPKPTWDSGTRPNFSLSWDSNGDIDEFKKNLKNLLNKTLDSQQNVTDADKLAVNNIVDAYVNAVKQNAGDGKGGWGQSISYFFDNSKPPNCLRYSQIVNESVGPTVNGTNWNIKRHEDSRKYGIGGADFLAWPFPGVIAAYHSFVTLSYNDEIVWILDPWATNRPDIYSPKPFLDTWPEVD
jgi:RHS repeat-associated protein